MVSKENPFSVLIAVGVTNVSGVSSVMDSVVGVQCADESLPTPVSCCCRSQSSASVYHHRSTFLSTNDRALSSRTASACPLLAYDTHRCRSSKSCPLVSLDRLTDIRQNGKPSYGSQSVGSSREHLRSSTTTSFPRNTSTRIGRGGLRPGYVTLFSPFLLSQVTDHMRSSTSRARRRLAGPPAPKRLSPLALPPLSVFAPQSVARLSDTTSVSGVSSTP